MCNEHLLALKKDMFHEGQMDGHEDSIGWLESYRGWICRLFGVIIIPWKEIREKREQLEEGKTQDGIGDYLMKDIILGGRG